MCENLIVRDDVGAFVEEVSLARTKRALYLSLDIPTNEKKLPLKIAGLGIQSLMLMLWYRRMRSV